MNEPLIVTAPDLGNAYLDALAVVRDHGWNCWNLTVQIQDCTLEEMPIYQQLDDLADELKILNPKHVAYTIFPQSLAGRTNGIADLSCSYSNRIYPRIRTSWGTYFQRIVGYSSSAGAPVVNQLRGIIDSMNSHSAVWHCAYTMLIPCPGSETRRLRGGPCLNYLAFQLDSGDPPVVNLLAVYRNHDFCRKAYGNYLGLCRLLRYVSEETPYAPGRLTCISSHAYVDLGKPRAKALLEVNHR